MSLSIEIEREKDGRWLAEVPEIPGVLVYGTTRKEAIQKVQDLSLRILADRLEHGEKVPNIGNGFFRQQQRWGPLNEKTVADFEIRNAFELPNDYRAFLLAHHGGVPEPSFYWVVRDDWGSDIETFYGFGRIGYDLQEYLDARELMGISSDMLVIGDDGCCNYLSIGISGSRRGQVFYIDHEFAPGEPKRERFLALSFKDFLSRLRVGPD